MPGRRDSLTLTKCNQESFISLHGREVVGWFDDDEITRDAGSLLLREGEKRRKIIDGFAGCFRCHRAAGAMEQMVTELVAQRVYAPAMGHVRLNDHEQLWRDLLLDELDRAASTGRGMKL